MIIGLYNEDGNWINSENEVEGVAVKYFTDLFHTEYPWNIDNFSEEVPTTVTANQNLRLMEKASEEEVREALFMMHPQKAPGPDGITALFYQQSWSISKKDVVEMFNNFLTT